MAVQKANTVPLESLAGKFACKDSMLTDAPAGPPVFITRVSGSRIYFISLERVRLPQAPGADAHGYVRMMPTAGQPEEYCTRKGLTLVCDTAEEAAAASAAARHCLDQVFAAQQRLRQEFFDTVLGPALVSPERAPLVVESDNPYVPPAPAPAPGPAPASSPAPARPRKPAKVKRPA